METKTPRKRDRSPEYPAASLRAAVEYVRRLYDQDRQNWTQAEVAVKHLGYSSLNGASRTTLSALRKFGLIEYRGGDLRVSDAAMRILLPHSDDEKASTLLECLLSPKIYAWVSEQYPDWELPSDETVNARLIRDLDFNPGATKGFLSDLRESIEFVRHSGGLKPATFESPQDSATRAPEKQPRHDEDVRVAATTGHRLSIPGQAWFVWLPDAMSPSEAKVMKRWVEMVLKPNLDFIANVEADLSEEA